MYLPSYLYRQWSEQASSVQTLACGAIFAAASVSRCFPGTSPCPQAHPSPGPSYYPSTATNWWKGETPSFWGALELNVNDTKYLGGAGNGIISGLQSSYRNWFWGCRKKGSLETNRNLQRDQGNTWLGCGWDRDPKEREAEIFISPLSVLTFHTLLSHGPKRQAP